MISSLWNGFQLLFRPYPYFRDARTTWRAPLPGLGSVLISADPGLVAEAARHPDLVGGRAHRAMRASLGDGHLIVMCGPEHRLRSRQVRRALQAFTSDSEMAEITRQEFARTPLRRPFSVQQVAHRASLRIILRGLVGRDETALIQLSQAFQASFSSPLLLFVEKLRRDWGPWSPWGRLLRRRARLQEALLQAARCAPPGSIAARLPSETWEYELLPQLMFGHETTAATFAWSFALLYPEARRRIANGEEAFTLAYVQECMRLCPPVAQLTRMATRELCLGSHSLRPGEVVMPALPGLHHHGWSHSDQLEPGRFLQETPDPHRYCPFGLGERICPGKPMALRQLVMMLQTVLQHFDIHPLAGYQPRPVRQLFLVAPAQGTPAIRRA
ncbi:MAG: cytochrome P450 [Candidatus Eremiobacteraeota bacterium]|nr:cytochrome P450 [Candidatus Eremiobacteraeota bacterium]MCW5865790.1 cytochrome P450 [Candidatus Eremiobacteraeota bacterium]